MTPSVVTKKWFIGTSARSRVKGKEGEYVPINKLEVATSENKEQLRKIIKDFLEGATEVSSIEEKKSQEVKRKSKRNQKIDEENVERKSKGLKPLKEVEKLGFGGKQDKIRGSEVKKKNC